jgi:hypothetical protein
MPRSLRTYLLIATAVGEAVTGLLLLAAPALPLWLLLNLEHPSPETAVVARIAGAALLAIGVGCWLGRDDPGSRAQRGLIGGVLVYSICVAVLLGYAGLSVGLVGIALWPAVALHVLLSLGCAICLRAG